MKVKEFNWTLISVVGLLMAVLMNGLVILLAAYIFKGDFSESAVRDIAGYVILFGLLSPLLAALISGVVVYRRSMKHTVHQSLTAAALTVIISLTLLITVTDPYAKEFSDEYTHRVDPITGE